MKFIRDILVKIQLQVQRPYYFLFLAILTMLDAFILIIPTDGLLVTSVLGCPKAWVRNAVGATIGAVLGAVTLAALIEVFGLSFLHQIAPQIESTEIWVRSTALMAQYGIYAIVFIALSPLPQLPIIALAALAKISLPLLGFLILGGRLIKYLVIAAVAAKSPELLNRIRGIQKEVAQAKKLSKL